MWHEILNEAKKSLWREIGRDVVKKGAATAVTETIRAAIDIVKQRRVRMEQYEFQQWKKEQEANEKESKDSKEPTGSHESKDPASKAKDKDGELEP